jgi:hypothetical protein
MDTLVTGKGSRCDDEFTGISKTKPRKYWPERVEWGY